MAKRYLLFLSFFLWSFFTNDLKAEIGLIDNDSSEFIEKEDRIFEVGQPIVFKYVDYSVQRNKRPYPFVKVLWELNNRKEKEDKKYVEDSTRGRNEEKIYFFEFTPDESGSGRIYYQIDDSPWSRDSYTTFRVEPKANQLRKSDLKEKKWQGDSEEIERSIKTRELLEKEGSKVTKTDLAPEVTIDKPKRDKAEILDHTAGLDISGLSGRVKIKASVIGHDESDFVGCEVDGEELGLKEIGSSKETVYWLLPYDSPHFGDGYKITIWNYKFGGKEKGGESLVSETGEIPGS